MKKLLALVLALVMTLGLATVGTSAAYSDADDIDYTEAVDVMTAVGVFQGKGDAFAPNDNLNRAEAAKLIAYLMLGNKTAESMVGSGTRFTDVPADHWAAGFIEYLASVGIVSGVGNNQFNPNGQVTGVQFAKMLLVALGYDAEIEKFVGDGWSINIQKVANQNDLFSGLDISANDALTRQQAAQMCLNDLKADMVEYADKGTTVNVGGATVTTGVKNAEEKVEKGSNNYNGAAAGTSDRNYRQLAEELYGNDLKLDDTSRDEFGRPTNKWTYKNIEVGEYSNRSDLLETYTAKFSKKSLYDLLGKDQYDNIKDGKTTLNLWLDGVKTTYNYATTDIATVMDRSDTGALNNSGNGTLTQVYLDDDNDIVNVVSVQTYVWQVTNDYSASRGDITIKSVGNDNGETTVSKRINPITLKDRTLKDDDFEEIKDLKKDDYVLITASHDASGDAYEVESIAKAELKTGKVSTFTEADTVTIDGTQLKYSKMAPVNTDHKQATYTVGEEARLVMDAYGYVIAVDEAVVNDNYVFISNIAATSGLNTNSEADAYFTDGSNAALKVNKLLGSDSKSTILGSTVSLNVGSFTSAGTNKTSNNAGWYTYSKASGDKYNLSAIGSSYAQAAYYYGSTGGDNNDVVTNNKVAFLKAQTVARGDADVTTLTKVTGTANPEALKANNDTVFVVEQDGDVNVYTGVKNAPGVSLKVANGDEAVVVAVYDATTLYAKYVYITLTKDAELDGGNNTELFYVLKNDTKNWIDEQNSYAMWYVINSEGKAELVKTDYDFTAGNYRGYYKVFKNSDGDYSKVTAITSTPGSLQSAGSHYYEFRNASKTNEPISYSKGALSIAGTSFTVTDDTKIVLVQAKTLSTTLMNNPDLNYEIEVIDGDTLEQKFTDCSDYRYNIQARIGGNVSDNDRDLKEIYVTITSAVKSGTITGNVSTTGILDVILPEDAPAYVMKDSAGNSSADNIGNNMTALLFYNGVAPTGAQAQAALENALTAKGYKIQASNYGETRPGAAMVRTNNGTYWLPVTAAAAKAIDGTANGGLYVIPATAFSGTVSSPATVANLIVPKGASLKVDAALTVSTNGKAYINGTLTFGDNGSISFTGASNDAVYETIITANGHVDDPTSSAWHDALVYGNSYVAKSGNAATFGSINAFGKVVAEKGATLKAATVTLNTGAALDVQTGSTAVLTGLTMTSGSTAKVGADAGLLVSGNITNNGGTLTKNAKAVVTGTSQGSTNESAKLASTQALTINKNGLAVIEVKPVTGVYDDNGTLKFTASSATVTVKNVNPSNETYYFSSDATPANGYYFTIDGGTTSATRVAKDSSFTITVNKPTSGDANLSISLSKKAAS